MKVGINLSTHLQPPRGAVMSDDTAGVTAVVTAD
jgi:hypothetical protein